MRTSSVKNMIGVLGMLMMSLSYGQEQEDKLYEKVDQLPQYQGGFDEMIAFLADEISYPKTASAAGITGKVFVSFIVEKDGSLSNIETVKGVDKALDQEAERVIGLLSDFIPGKHQGKLARVKMVLPIMFALDEEDSKGEK
ncbi:MAG: energy transducer TonB [Cyclobacteriaceae bacterium]